MLQNAALSLSPRQRNNLREHYLSNIEGYIFVVRLSQWHPCLVICHCTLVDNILIIIINIIIIIIITVLLLSTLSFYFLTVIDYYYHHVYTAEGKILA